MIPRHGYVYVLCSMWVFRGYYLGNAESVLLLCSFNLVLISIIVRCITLSEITTN